jgi:hypothetical protein
MRAYPPTAEAQRKTKRSWHFVPGTFDRDLTVTGVNIREQRETSAPATLLKKADF